MAKTPDVDKFPTAAHPKIVATRQQVGDWEADTIVGKNHQAIVSLVERKTRYCLLHKVERKTASAIESASCRRLGEHRELVHTITSDNKREFAHHEQIAECLEADFYFANPHHSWEHGTNENTNGLVRQYFLKPLAFVGITDEQIQAVEDKSNSRPRKTLGYRTSKELFFKEKEIPLTT